MHTLFFYKNVFYRYRGRNLQNETDFEKILKRMARKEENKFKMAENAK